MSRSVKSDRVEESEMHAQKTMSHSDVADTGADNSVTSRMELCTITNLEFTIGKRKRRRTLDWQALHTQGRTGSLFGSSWRPMENNNILGAVTNFLVIT
jgi:hypothetical protein